MKTYIAALVALIVVGFSACGGSDLSTEDAHDTRNRCRLEGSSSVACLDDSQKRVIAFPNHYANLSTACDGFGHRIYITTRGNPPQIIADPSCPGWTEDTPRTGVVQVAR